ncbi:hypothetical protein NPIL_63641 [Nephila pilipes]|uniref:Uncharacterized protein n=1 Tax=Nephila pilipes TaxID=299642 RepID=A0A8X6U5L1_NEPPI|nr:hypothetical protein NPIL_63641 [Nephila pilipes]
MRIFYLLFITVSKLRQIPDVTFVEGEDAMGYNRFISRNIRDISVLIVGDQLESNFSKHGFHKGCFYVY